MQKGALIFLLGILPALLQGQENALKRLLESRELQHAAVSISVKSSSTRSFVDAYQPAMALTPASVTKLLPTALALESKGAGFRYETPVFLTGGLENKVLEGNIILEASGDPCPDSRYFKNYGWIEGLVKKFRETGIDSVAGEIRIAGEDRPVAEPGAWLWEDISNYYGACHFCFNYRDNTYTLKFRTGSAGTPAVLLETDPPQPGIRFRNELTASASAKDNAWIYGGPYSGLLCIKGTIPQQRPLFSVKGAIHHPAACFIAELTARLRQEGIGIGKKRLNDEKKREWFRFQSPPLGEIVRQTNKKSINLFAEALGRLVTSGNFQESCRQQLEKMGISAEGILLKDACGLSPLNAVPAEVFTDLLVRMRDKEAFCLSLPVAGTDNSLNAYCANHPGLKNRMYAKTGSFAGVRCLAGYLHTRRGEWLAFTILVNHFSCSPAALQKAIGTYLEALL